MALLPFFRREEFPGRGLDISPWRDLDPWADSRVGTPNYHFKSHLSGILQQMDSTIARMDEEMRTVMKRVGAGDYAGGSMLGEAARSVSPQINNGLAIYDFDVSGFTPEEVTIKTKDNVLEVIARHEERTKNGEISREFRRTFTIPDGINPEELSGKLIRDGLLRVEAPYRPPALQSSPSERPVPIQYS
ncbi:HSP20-4 [Ramazzottius varieornatus]|uniref:HSP20-4 n=1 Tax=Ramazzottius varieornatus TaxID=947166 RepID=A0A1D1VW57_RAMVA|nr:HSP20-4 [Ramazzottius varieornatus]